MAGQSRDYWWAQQLSAATMLWSIFVAIEGELWLWHYVEHATLLLTGSGRRRNIPHTWAFVLLAHLVGLSTSQNLFNIALLLTPLPIVRKHVSGTNRETTWTLRARFHIIPVVITAMCTALFPYASSNPALLALSAIPVAMTFVPLLVTNSKVIPEPNTTSSKEPNLSSSFRPPGAKPTPPSMLPMPPPFPLSPQLPASLWVYTSSHQSPPCSSIYPLPTKLNTTTSGRSTQPRS